MQESGDIRRAWRLRQLSLSLTRYGPGVHSAALACGPAPPAAWLMSHLPQYWGQLPWREYTRSLLPSRAETQSQCRWRTCSPIRDERRSRPTRSSVIASFIEDWLWSPVERRHQLPVGGAGGSEFVVAVLQILLGVEELLLKFGDSVPQVGDFASWGEAGIVEDLFAEHFGESFGELGVLVTKAFVVCTEIGQVGQQRPPAGAGAARRGRFGFVRSGKDPGS